MARCYFFQVFARLRAKCVLDCAVRTSLAPEGRNVYSSGYFVHVPARLRAKCVPVDCGHIALLKECLSVWSLTAINIRSLRDPTFFQCGLASRSFVDQWCDSGFERNATLSANHLLSYAATSIDKVRRGQGGRGQLGLNFLASKNDLIVLWDLLLKLSHLVSCIIVRESNYT